MIETIRKYSIQAGSIVPSSIKKGSPPVLFNASLTSSIVPEIGSLNSATHNSSYVIQDHEGVLRTTGAGEIGFWGGRRVKNLFQESENFTNALWVAGGTATKVGQTSIDGFDVMEVSFGSVSTDILYQAYATSNGNDYRPSFTVRSKSGNTTIRVRFGPDYTADIPITESWSIITCPAFTESSETARFIGIVNNTSGDAGNVYLRRAQLQSVTGQGNQAPSEYVSTGIESAPYHGANVDGVKWFETENGNTVTSNIVTEGTGAALTTLNGLVSDPGSTNKCTNYNFRPTGLAGISIGTPANVTGSAIVPSAYPSELVGIGNGRVLEFVSTSGSSEVNFSGATGNTNSHSIIIWARKTSGTGASTAGLASAQIGAELITGTWTKHTLENLTPSSVGNIIKLFIDNTDTVEVIGNQLEESATVGLPIVTEGAAVSTVGTKLIYNSSTGLANDYKILVDWTPRIAGDSPQMLVANYTDASNYIYLFHDTDTLYFRTRIAGVNYDATYSITPTPGTTYSVEAVASSTAGKTLIVDTVSGTGHANTADAVANTVFYVGSDSVGGQVAEASFKEVRVQEL